MKLLIYDQFMKKKSHRLDLRNAIFGKKGQKTTEGRLDYQPLFRGENEPALIPPKEPLSSGSIKDRTRETAEIEPKLKEVQTKMNENLSRNLQEHVFSSFFFLRCDQKQFKHFLRMCFKVTYCYRFCVTLTKSL